MKLKIFRQRSEFKFITAEVLKLLSSICMVKWLSEGQQFDIKLIVMEAKYWRKFSRYMDKVSTSFLNVKVILDELHPVLIFLSNFKVVQCKGDIFSFI